MIRIAGDSRDLEKGREVNLVLSIGFFGQAVKSLRLSEDAIENGQLDKRVTAGAIGMVCLAQGLELLFKAILLVRKVPEPKGKGQHPLLPMFDLIMNEKEIQGAICKMLADEGCSQPTIAARDTVEVTQESFYTARYLGFSDHKQIFFPKSRQVSLFVFALFATNFGRYIEYASEEMELPVNLNFDG